MSSYDLPPNLQFVDEHPKLESFRGTVLKGMREKEKRFSPKFLYDSAGSKLFNQICQQPEYYQTQTELKILESHVKEIEQLLGKSCLFIELGSGHSRKIRTILEDFPQDSVYMPVDISKEYLLENARRLALDYPELQIVALCADFLQPFYVPALGRKIARKVIFFPGSTIGNFEPGVALNFLRSMHELVGPGGGLMIGVDLKKDVGVLNAAYNDKARVTEAFELNALSRMNRELAANFVLENFEYSGFYNESFGRVEMYVVSKVDQSVSIAGENFHFGVGEKLHLENSYKYTVEEFRDIAASVGWRSKQVWVDDQKLFSVHFFEA